MLTRGGLATAVAAAALVASGRVFGFLELFLVGAGLAVVVVVALLWVRVRRLRVELRRVIVPLRVNAGQPARVDLQVTSLGRRRNPVLELSDPVSGTRGARLRVSPLAGGGTARAAYQLPTARRGVVEVGPLVLSVSDPFGLARSSFVAAGVTRLVVYPRIDRISPLRRTTGSRSTPGIDRGASHADRGDDFHALRPYVVGDDLRRVHWPSTARHDQLMVRQDRHPRQGRLTVLLDVDAETTSEPALDEAVAVAASVLTANRRRGDLVRLLSSDGTDSGFLRDPARVDAVLEYLALVQPRRGARFVDAVERTLAQDAPSAVLTVTGPLDDTGRRALERILPSVASLTSVVIDPSLWDPAVPAPAAVPTPRLMVVGRDAPFADVWAAAFADRAPAAAGAPR